MEKAFNNKFSLTLYKKRPSDEWPFFVSLPSSGAPPPQGLPSLRSGIPSVVASTSLKTIVSVTKFFVP